MLSLLVSVVDNSSNWAVCGKSSGVISMPVAARATHRVHMEVMPLFAGYLPLPDVRLFKYLPHHSAHSSQLDAGKGSAVKAPSVRSGRRRAWGQACCFTARVQGQTLVRGTRPGPWSGEQSAQDPGARFSSKARPPLTSLCPEGRLGRLAAPRGGERSARGSLRLTSCALCR